MNAAARLLNQGMLSRSWVMSLFLTKTQYALFACMLALLLSALSIVYVTNTTRGFNSAMQQMMADRDQMHIRWGQLLLEKSTWTTQARVQSVAEDKLSMVIPDSKSVVVINE